MFCFITLNYDVLLFSNFEWNTDPGISLMFFVYKFFMSQFVSVLIDIIISVPNSKLVYCVYNKWIPNSLRCDDFYYHQDLCKLLMIKRSEAYEDFLVF